jgi:hypothetical protein
MKGTSENGGALKLTSTQWRSEQLDKRQVTVTFRASSTLSALSARHLIGLAHVPIADAHDRHAVIDGRWSYRFDGLPTLSYVFKWVYEVATVRFYTDFCKTFATTVRLIDDHTQTFARLLCDQN